MSRYYCYYYYKLCNWLCWHVPATPVAVSTVAWPGFLLPVPLVWVALSDLRLHTKQWLHMFSWRCRCGAVHDSMHCYAHDSVYIHCFCSSFCQHCVVQAQYACLCMPWHKDYPQGQLHAFHLVALTYQPECRITTCADCAADAAYKSYTCAAYSTATTTRVSW